MEQLKTATFKTIKQSELSSECWNVQVWGLEYCKTCEYRNTKDCGGKKILKTKKNEKGIKIPLKNRA